MYGYDQPAIQTHLRRGLFFAGLFGLGCANGLAVRMVRSIRETGFVDAAFRTFDISLIVLVACFVGVSLVSRDAGDEIRPADLAIGAVVVALFIVPVTTLSWLAVGILSLYILLLSDAGELARRGAKILLATTGPMLVAIWLFEFFSGFILSADAMLVSWVLGADRTGIFVEFVDHSGTAAIYPGCSSLPNMALAVLCWVTITQWVGHKWRAQDAVWFSLAILSVWVVNVARMSIMGLGVSYYTALHSPLGNIPTNAGIMCLTIGFCMVGARRELFSRA